MTDPTSHRDDARPAGGTATSPRVEGPSRAALRRRTRLRVLGFLGVALVIAAVWLTTAVRAEMERMRTIPTETCAPPRTSWVPFLQIELLSCFADVPPPPPSE